MFLFFAACLLLYGFLAKSYGHIAIGGWMENGIIQAGLARGLAGCFTGCILYELVLYLKRVRLTQAGRVAFFLLELCGYAYFFYAVQKLPKSRYDYLLVFLLFFLLAMGISGLTGLWKKYSHPKTKILGLCSTLFVLNHYHWNDMLKYLLGADYGKTSWAWAYFALVLLSSLVAYGMSLIGTALARKVHPLLFEKTAKN